MTDPTSDPAEPTRPGRWAWLWRWGSPSSLLLALLMFPLPWVQIQCEDRGRAVTPGVKQPIDFVYSLNPFAGRVMLCSQTGWQAARGVCHANPGLENAAQLKRDMEAVIGPSAWAALFPLPVAVGVALGVWLKERRRRLAVLACALTALALLAGQLVQGFPLDEGMRQVFREDLEKQTKEGGAKEGVIVIALTPWFALACYGPLGAVGLVLLETFVLWRAARRREPVAVAEGL